jgi:hypothetical protein
MQGILEIAGLASDRGLHSACFWKLPVSSRYDTPYDLRLPLVSRIIAELRSRGIEMGFHPSYSTFGNPRQLAAEAAALKEWLGVDVLGGRQHYLRWSPETWSHWESCGLLYDSSVGFAEMPGFRAGTAHPYHPWLFDENRPAQLLEIPLIIMDRTLTNYMKVTSSDAAELMVRLIERTKAVAGVFTALWHNSNLFTPGTKQLYCNMLDALAIASPFSPRACENHASIAAQHLEIMEAHR